MIDDARHIPDQHPILHHPFNTQTHHNISPPILLLTPALQRYHLTNHPLLLLLRSRGFESESDYGTIGVRERQRKRVRLSAFDWDGGWGLPI